MKPPVTALGAATALALCLGAGSAAAQPVAIFDPTIADVPTTTTVAETGNPDLGSYSQIRAQSGGSILNDFGWRDSSNPSIIPGTPFNSGNVYLSWSGTNVILTLNSSMPLGGVQTSVDNSNLWVGFADIFFDLNPNTNINAAPSWDFGLDINNGYGADGFGQNVNSRNEIQFIQTQLNIGTHGRLVADPTFATAESSIGFHQTKVCTDGSCDDVNGRNPEVEVTNGSDTDPVFAITQTGTGELGTLYQYTITLLGVNTGGSWNNLRVFWATAWCANDTVEGLGAGQGTAVVPVPAALPIIAAALGGFAFAGWRQTRRPA